MGLKSTKVKNMNDLIGGMLFMGAGAWLMFSDNIIEGRIPVIQAHGIIRADTYIRMLGGLILFLAFLMIVRSINFKKEATTKAFEFHISKESILTFAGLVLFVAFLRPLGFVKVTFLFSFFIGCVYMLKETKNEGIHRREKIKKIISIGVFSLILVLTVYLVFGRVLLVQLP